MAEARDQIVLRGNRCIGGNLGQYRFGPVMMVWFSVLAVLGIGFFGACRNRIEAFTTEATVEALDLLEYLRAAPRGYGDPPVAAEV